MAGSSREGSSKEQDQGGVVEESVPPGNKAPWTPLGSQNNVQCSDTSRRLKAGATRTGNHEKASALEMLTVYR
jgi:hypothetical protein